MRRDRKRTIKVWADPDPNSPTNSFALFERLEPQGRSPRTAPRLCPFMGGEHESQEKATKRSSPLCRSGFWSMFAITVMLFNSFKQTLVVLVDRSARCHRHDHRPPAVQPALQASPPFLASCPFRACCSKTALS